MKKDIQILFGAAAENGRGGEFGIDDDGQLYWNGKPVVTEKKVKLQWWVNCSAIAAAASTVIMAIVSVVDFIRC
ncbi:hypothetical protein EKK97_10925 [Billgrantia tianxiuensis]|jgi:hypothetical protein|uniref:Uncharacterized protein n=1 Tax=Billgrantia tianxiuensis TaxID=2497861 RepID=A0A6I6SL58_9GAMM|nr:MULTISPECIES: hypothetical protein [Halomonas]MCE8031914.1 hypothetical protein [Halomonas sp. MCCC 1A11057]QHC50011.1 hypothetical protein EKK97_10925 [Halomonas tianxiuensis]